MPDEDIPEEPDEREEYAWRFDQLVAAGYPADIAKLLCERSDIDLHEACDLLAKGATMHQALRILT